MKRLVFPLISLNLLVCSTAISAQKLSEEKVVQWTKTNSIFADALKAETAGKKLDSYLVDEQYQTRLKARHLRKKSDEIGSVFQPVLSPFTETSISVEKKIPVGLALSAGVFAQQSSLQDNTVVDDTQVGLQLQAEMDLFKNFLGRTDRARIHLAESKLKVADLEVLTNSRKHEISVRKMYWSLVAIEKNISLSKDLLKSAETQLAESEKRLRAGVADRGEVAKYKSQYESRKASQLLFEYERQVLISELEKILHDFDSKEWTLPADELDRKEVVIGECLAAISNVQSSLDQLTDKTEIIKALKSQSDSEIHLAQQHAGPEVMLIGAWQTSGRSNSYSQAEDNLRDEKKSGYSMGVQLIIPLDKKASRSEDELELLKKNEYAVKIRSLEKELGTTQTRMSQSLLLLKQGLETQTTNSKNLEINYNEMRRKFQQGRIPFTNLISEQDLLFQSKLQENNIKKQIAHATLDYLMVFNKFPCSWNQY